MKRTLPFLVIASLMAACSDGELPTGAAPDALMSKANSGVLTVTTLADGPVGPCTSGSCTLRSAIAAAQHGDRIVFKNNVAGTIQLVSGVLIVQASVVIEGSGRITLDALGGSSVLYVSAEADQVTLSGLTVTGGHHGGVGGGIINLANLTLMDCVVTGNTSDAQGGGIFNGNRLTLIRTTVSGNQADTGGGIRNIPSATTHIIASTVSGNQSIGRGAGVYNTGHLFMSRSTVSGNSSASGVGGIYTGHDGVGEASASLVSSTVTRNTGGGSDAGGVYSGVVTTTLANSIIAGNFNQFWPDCEGNFASLGFNLVLAGGTCPSNGTADVAVNPAQLFTHVLADALADNGGPTLTHALVERGRAVDAGYCPGETLDQRGFVRPYDVLLMPNALDACDIGAVEWQPAPQTKNGKGPKK